MNVSDCASMTSNMAPSYPVQADGSYQIQISDHRKFPNFESSITFSFSFQREKASKHSIVVLNVRCNKSKSSENIGLEESGKISWGRLAHPNS